jgi:hypothetical protein
MKKSLSLILSIAYFLPLSGVGYNVRSTTYSPSITLPATEGTEILNCDNCSQMIPIGFTFTFYGVDYTDLYVGSNGYLTFDIGANNDVPQLLPAINLPPAIFGFWRSLDTEGGTVYYSTIGSAPHRQLVVSFNKVPYGNNAQVTMQFVLSETSNNIELFYLEWTGATIVTEGIQNQNRDLATTIPGRNDLLIAPSTAPEGWLFGVTVLPPANAQGVQVKNQFAMQAEWVNIITWEPSLVEQEVTDYAVYSDSALTNLLATIPSNWPLVFQQRNCSRNKTYTYYIVAKGANGFSSVPARVIINPFFPSCPRNNP